MVSSDFRKNARESLKGRWEIAIIAFIIASILGAASGIRVSFNFDLNESSGEASTEQSEQTWGELVEYIRGIEPGVLISIITTAISAFIIGACATVIIFIISSAAKVGYAKFNLDLVDRKEVSYSPILQYFSFWRVSAVAELLKTLYIALWSLLFIVPGIIAHYRYSMVSYILAEFPEITASEALETSKKMMKGNKSRLFCLDLSFIGWAVLNTFTLGIGSVVLMPYMNAARADFYREISGTRPVPEENTDEEAPIDDENAPTLNEEIKEENTEA